MDEHERIAQERRDKHLLITSIGNRYPETSLEKASQNDEEMLWVAYMTEEEKNNIEKEDMEYFDPIPPDVVYEIQRDYCRLYQSDPLMQYIFRQHKNSNSSLINMLRHMVVVLAKAKSHFQEVAFRKEMCKPIPCYITEPLSTTNDKYEWTKTWPTEPGKYWFYGKQNYDDKGKYDKDQIYLAKVNKTDDSITVIIEGISALSDHWTGWFAKAIIPKLPNED